MSLAHAWAPPDAVSLCRTPTVPLYRSISPGVIHQCPSWPLGSLGSLGQLLFLVLLLVLSPPFFPIQGNYATISSTPTDP